MSKNCHFILFEIFLFLFVPIFLTLYFFFTDNLIPQNLGTSFKYWMIINLFAFRAHLVPSYTFGENKAWHSRWRLMPNESQSLWHLTKRIFVAIICLIIKGEKGKTWFFKPYKGRIHSVGNFFSEFTRIA